MIHRINLVLSIVFVAILALLVLFRVNHSRPNYQIILGDDMTYSPAYTAYAPNQNFANGRTLQNFVPGTLARGEQRFDFEATPQDAIRAGEQLTNPFAPGTKERAAAADRGAIVFQTICIVCHGGDGAGNGPVARRGFPPPPSLLTGKSRDMKDGQLFHILTFGQNNMPSFAVQLPPDRRWDVINHIRRLQQEVKPPAAADSTTTVPAGEHTEGPSTGPEESKP
jgi:mono/diheme cytochrome c family protein